MWRFGAQLLICSAFALHLYSAEDTRVADAAQQDDIAAVRHLLDERAAVNGKQGDGSTALHWAATHDNRELVKLLIASGADVKLATRVGALTPLAMAAQNGDSAILDMLLKAGGDSNAATADGATVLMTAAASGSVEAVRLLLDRGANVNARETKYGQTALMFAAALNRAPVVKLLLAKGADPDIATHLTRYERIKLDVDGNIVPEDGKPQDKRAAGAKTDAHADTAKPANPPPAVDPKEQIASLSRQVEALQKRLDELEKSKTGGKELSAAADDKSAEDTGARTRAGKAGDVVFQGPREVGSTLTGGMSALLLAAREGHLETARELLDGGANIDQVSGSDRTSPLVMAIINGHLDLARFLVDRGAAANLATLSGLTPLIAAIDVQWAPRAWFPQPNLTQEKTSYLELTKDLLDHGANPNARLLKKLWFRGLSQDPTWVDPAGATAFWRAAQATDIEAMRLLVKAGADPHIPSLAGGTPLMVASGVGWMANHTNNAMENWLSAVKYCVELGEDVNASDARGYTSLHGAAYIGNDQIVLYLIDHGAKIDAKTKAGDTVADMANGPTRFGLPHPETLALLEKLGSINSRNCRSDQCLPPPKEDKKKDAPDKNGPAKNAGSAPAPTP